MVQWRLSDTGQVLVLGGELGEQLTGSEDLVALQPAVDHLRHDLLGEVLGLLLVG